MFVHGRTLSLLGLLSLGVCFGCGKGEQYLPPATKSEQAAEAKQRVSSFVALAKERPQAAPGELTLLLETLEANATQLDNSANVITSAKDLKALYDRRASKSEVETQVQKLSAAASAM